MQNGAGCFGIKIQNIYYSSSSSYSVETLTLTCSWSEGTEVIGCLSVVLGMAFLISFAFLNVRSSVWIAGLISSIGLLLAATVMIVDIANGVTYYHNYYDYKTTTTNAYSYDVAGFVANIVLAFVTFIIMLVATAAARTEIRKGSTIMAPLMTQAAPPQYQQFTAA